MTRCSSIRQAALPAATASSSTIAAGEGTRARRHHGRGRKGLPRARAGAPQLDVTLDVGGRRASRLAAAGDDPVRPRAAVAPYRHRSAPTAPRCLLCESVVFGRAAHGRARASRARFVDRWRVRRGGRLVFAETVRLDGAIGEQLGRPAVANGGVAVGTVADRAGRRGAAWSDSRAVEPFGGEVGVIGLEWIRNGALLCAEIGAACAPTSWRCLRRCAAGCRGSGPIERDR